MVGCGVKAAQRKIASLHALAGPLVNVADSAQSHATSRFFVDLKQPGRDDEVIGTLAAMKASSHEAEVR